jgi:hypothetical protein
MTASVPPGSAAPGGTRRRRWAGGVVGLAVLVGACGQPGDDASSDAPSRSTPAPTAPVALPQPVQRLEIDATEYTFEISPDPAAGLQPGWTLLDFRNVGDEPHQVMFAQLKEGVDLAELAAAGANDSSGAAAIEFVNMIGGVSYIGADQETTALVNLTEGIVLAMCYVPDGRGVAHALMGMTTTMSVSAPATDGAPAPSDSGPEEVLGTIELAADGYEIPADLRAGWYHVENTDDALHELSLLRLGGSLDDEATGALVEDLAANRPPSVEVEAVGGLGAISSGFDGYVYLDLAPGDYLAVDFMPDPGEPRPHMLDGYFDRFTVDRARTSEP